MPDPKVFNASLHLLFHSSSHIDEVKKKDFEKLSVQKY